MTNERLRVPQDPEYFKAIGLAVIAFARLEWDAVWCCERIEPGYTGTLEDRWDQGRKIQRGKTAGTIATDLQKCFSRIVDPDLRDKASPLAATFVELTNERNRLIHGKPGTAPNEDQRLFRHGTEWTIETVNSFADRCVIAAAPLNALLYEELSAPCTVILSK